jgi:hypothetical protein
MVSPMPGADALQVEPAEAVHDQPTALKLAGNASLTVAPTTALGPLLVTMMV